eukprot:3981934-Amphidinium_carterae.1
MSVLKRLQAITAHDLKPHTMTQIEAIGGNQPMSSLMVTKEVTSGTLLVSGSRRRPRRIEPTNLEPTPTQTKGVGMGTLKHAGFSKAKQEVGHLSRSAKL